MIISIVVPFYKGNTYIPSLLMQFNKNKQSIIKSHLLITLEMVIINDSPNIKVDIKESEDIRIINNEKNVGIQQTRINGLNYIKGEYVVFLDQDDYISSSYIVHQYLTIKDADMAVCNALEEKNNEKIKFYKSTHHHQQINHLDYYFTVTNQIISPGQCLIKTDKIPSLWKKNIVKINGADDMLLWVLMLLEGCQFACNKACDYTHVDTGNNVSKDDELMHQSKLEVYSILTRNKLLTQKQARRLLRCIKWKKYLYDPHPRLLKYMISIGYIDMVSINVYYQMIKRRLLK